MTRLTPEQIAEKTDHCKTILGNRRAINKLYRNQDESHKWPICGKFNATNRAILRVRRLDTGFPVSGIEYAYAIDNEISNIVNQ